MKTNQIMNMMSIYYRSGAYKMTQGNSFHRGTTYSFHRGIVKGDLLVTFTLLRLGSRLIGVGRGNVKRRSESTSAASIAADVPALPSYTFSVPTSPQWDCTTISISQYTLYIFILYIFINFSYLMTSQHQHLFFYGCGGGHATPHPTRPVTVECGSTMAPLPTEAPGFRVAL